MVTVFQVGNILSSHVAYGAILARNSSDFLKCLKDYVQTEEQWLLHFLAENTGATQVGFFIGCVRSCDQQPYLFIETKESICIKKSLTRT